MTRLARAGKCGGFGANGSSALAAAAFCVSRLALRNSVSAAASASSVARRPTAFNPLLRMSASAEAPFHGTENSRPSTATVSPRPVMIDSACVPVLSASVSAPGSTNSEFNPPAASSAVRLS